MSFFSTRSGDCATASQAILRGLAADGGLFVPSMFPSLPQEKISQLCGQSFQKRSARVLRDYLEDYSISEIENAVNRAYSAEEWDDPAIAPVRTLAKDTHVLELFHGPTLAFKDIALKLLPHLVSLAAEKNNEKREISIIVATSGDTGKAALEGFKDVPGTSCSVLRSLVRAGEWEVSRPMIPTRVTSCAAAVRHSDRRRMVEASVFFI